ncbi:hypothetical protein, partial [Bacillus cereus]|uniref:hypothetical protein n=1 Tax=Bacillus cereus TaxID=1396 RepID=UPI001C54DBF6
IFWVQFNIREFFAVDNFIHKTDEIASNFQKHLIFFYIKAYISCFNCGYFSKNCGQRGYSC